MALGFNYGAFSLSFSASLNGLLWRDVLNRMETSVSRLEFARANLPIIAIAWAIACGVLVIQLFVVRSYAPYTS